MIKPIGQIQNMNPDALLNKDQREKAKQLRILKRKLQVVKSQIKIETNIAMMEHYKIEFDILSKEILNELAE